MNNSEQQRKLILEGYIPRVVVNMAIPSVVMQMINLVYNMVDTYFIAQIDKSAAAAVGTVFSVQSIIQAVGFGFGMGVSSLCSRKLGEARDDEANKLASSGVFGAIVVAIIIGILGILFLNPLLRLIGCTETMLDYGRDYAIVILISAPMTCAGFVVNNILKGEGHLKFSMYGIVTGAVLNGLMDPVLIFVCGLGTFGAALSTAISQLVTLVISCSMFYRKKTVVKIKPQYISRNFDTYVQIVTTGLPTVFRQGLGSLATALLCKQGSHYGDAAVAAVTISNKCYMLVRNVVLGIGQGTQPVAGYNYGAGKYKRAKASYDFAIKVGSVLCFVSAAVLFYFARDIMWWFCKDEEVLAYGIPALKFVGMVVPVMSLSTYTNQEYQCLGFRTQASFLASCRQGICFIPLILLLPHFIGVKGVEMAQPLADFLTFLISIPFYFYMSNLLLKKEAQIQTKEKEHIAE